MFILFWFFVFADNIELHTSEFRTIHCFGKTIEAEDLGDNNSVKISYLGNQRLVYSVIEPGELVFWDSTVYFGDDLEPVFRIDYEYKLVGLAVFAWKFSIFCTVVGVIFASFILLVFRYIDNGGKLPKVINNLLTSNVN